MINKLSADSVENTVMSITRGLNSITGLTSALDVLKERLQRENIIKEQNSAYPEIYKNCLSSRNFTYIEKTNEKETMYYLVTDLLMISKEGGQIVIPPKLVGALVSHVHLGGHLGLTRMMANLAGYYF